MTSRALLRSQIRKAWRQTINEDYMAERINSERSLQAAFWSRLNQILPSKTRRTFIEPRLFAIGKPRAAKYPDIVICNSREVIGIIELKYQPRGRPSWDKDLTTFRWIAKSKTHISVSNERFRGVTAGTREYRIAKHILYVWAGVHADSQSDLRPDLGKLASHFMPLRAATRDDHPPRLIF
jgi:hypothetical protein